MASPAKPKDMWRLMWDCPVCLDGRHWVFGATEEEAERNQTERTKQCLTEYEARVRERRRVERGQSKPEEASRG